MISLSKPIWCIKKMKKISLIIAAVSLFATAAQAQTVKSEAKGAPIAVVKTDPKAVAAPAVADSAPKADASVASQAQAKPVKKAKKAKKAEAAAPAAAAPAAAPATKK